MTKRFSSQFLFNFTIKFSVYSIAALENKGRGKSLVIPVVEIVL